MSPTKATSFECGSTVQTARNRSRGTSGSRSRGAYRDTGGCPGILGYAISFSLDHSSPLSSPPSLSLSLLQDRLSVSKEVLPDDPGWPKESFLAAKVSCDERSARPGGKFVADVKLYNRTRTRKTPRAKIASMGLELAGGNSMLVGSKREVPNVT